MSAANHSRLLRIKHVLLAGLALLPLLPTPGICGQRSKAPSGHIVWWGRDEFWKNYYSDHTNGLIEYGDEFVTNAVALAASTWQGLALRSDGTVMGIGHKVFGGDDIPPGLSNVVSVAVEGDNFWAIRRDGTVVRWGRGEATDVAIVVAHLTNIVSIAGACDGCVNGRYLALRKDGTVVGFRLDNPRPWLPLVKVHGEVLSNVVALASMEMTPLVLKRDGMVYSLGYQTPGKPPATPVVTKINETTLEIDYGGESAYVSYQYTTADPVTINGQVLSNVTAIAGGGGNQLALKRDGTVVGWGITCDCQPPPGLSNVVAIAATEHEDLALKRDGTVVAWGADYSHQLSVPAGLSNVVAIASAGDFNLAITTGSIPASVFIQPHGRLEEMAQKADLVFKGQVLSTSPITNETFGISSMTVNATKFKVISVIKGKAMKEVVFEHYSGWSPQGGFWSGPSPPAMYKFEAGQSYIVFAARMNKPDVYYSPAAGETNIPGVLRQIADVPKEGSDGVMRTLDARPIAGYSVKEAHWVELNRLLNDRNPTNALYAIDMLDRMSLKGEPYEEWRRSGDFKRSRVFGAFVPLIQNKNEQVAIRAMSCFEVTSNASAVLKPYAGVLIKAANKERSPARRLAAISALSGIDDEAVSNSLAQLLRDRDENVRASAVHLLPRFPADFAEPALREAAKDASPKVRAAVADAIGDGKMIGMLPTLKVLLTDPVGLTNPVPPLTLEDLQGGGHVYGNNRGDVHTSAGYALLKFDVGDVADILKAHLNDKGFRPSYLCRLAQNNPGPWLTNLIELLTTRRENNWVKAQASGLQDKTNYFNALMTLSGTYFQCWKIICDDLDKLPSSAFQDGKLDWCLDALENAGYTGSREPVMLYKLYRKKGLNERATKFRQENGKCHGFDVTRYFDDVDGELKASAGKQ